MKVQFSNVGRSQKSWKSDLPNLDYGTLFREVKRAGALGSHGIDFEWNNDTQQGVILVGGFREVGSFTVEDRYIQTT